MRETTWNHFFLAVIASGRDRFIGVYCVLEINNLMISIQRKYHLSVTSEDLVPGSGNARFVFIFSNTVSKQAVDDCPGGADHT